MEKHRALEIKLVLLLHRISSMKDVEQVQAFIAKAGLVNYPPLVAKLISLTSVSSWGCVSHAQSLFEETTMDDTLLCNTMIRAYSRSVFPIRALCIYNRMQELNLGSDNFTFNFALRACARAMKRFQEDCRFELAKGAEIHCRILKLGFDRYLNILNSLIEAAKELFQEMPERDAVSWNSIIAAYVQAKNYDGALNLFREMQDSKVEATEVTLISILGACAKTGALDIGTEIHVSLVKKCYKVEGYLGNALVDMYAKCGKLNSAREVFDELKMKPVSCWNAMIVGLAVHGGSEEALELFAEMENRLDEVRPNRVTFIGVLIACRHKGLVEEGRQYFDRMIQQYNIKPDIKHYGCMIDLLSRWGFLYEAYEMIKTRSGETSSVIWRTLLGACTVHRNMDMAEKCFQQLAELELLKDADYVLLSNIYAEAERWDDVERLRNEMVTAGVVKILGYSHIGEGNFK
ncbi:hypothetical protein F8388_024931 [Cannabis sativa]|uniref:Pentatricopeptide repeat-containing protein n=1 Tax=Cannabis sativa TaxID=3483 RepID=A0A7J6GAP4_CANSA|nr:hypothetical protein G4B88_010068 [Cannabis sativa]KAF4379898.1 hypothetical protein F8388_024931 [Cannabis sativa]